MKRTHRAEMWRFLDLDKIDGFYSAAIFESVAKHVGMGEVPETILFWRVAKPVVYIGYHQYVEDELYVEFCNENNISIIRRILGGGCGFCNENQILYSIIGKEGGIIPRDIRYAYQKVLRGVVNALVALGLDGTIEEERNAVYTQGRKISGNAQGRLNNAVLVNGSFLLDFDFETMDKVLKAPTKNLRPVKRAKDGMITLKELGITDIEKVKKVLRKGFEEALGITTKKGILTQSEIELANNLLEKYTKKEWIYRMDTKRALRKKSGVPSPQPSL